MLCIYIFNGDFTYIYAHTKTHTQIYILSTFSPFIFLNLYSHYHIITLSHYYIITHIVIDIAIAINRDSTTVILHDYFSDIDFDTLFSSPSPVKLHLTNEIDSSYFPLYFHPTINTLPQEEAIACLNRLDDDIADCSF